MNMTSICFVPTLRRFHSSVGVRSIVKSEHLNRIEPVQMSFNCYEPNKHGNNKDRIPLLIMHGLFGSKSNWNSLSKALSNITGRKIIAVDARNHGDSLHTEEFSYYHLVEDINYLMKKLKITQMSLMGHSMGGRAAMLYAHVYPETLDKLIVVDISHKYPGGEMSGMSKYFGAMKSVKLSSNLSMSEGRKEANLQLSSSIPELEIRQFLLTNLIKEENSFKWRLNIDILEKAFKSEISAFPDIHSVFNKPTLFIGGTKSSYLRKEDHGDILRMFPHAVFEYLDAGHWVHAEKPNEFLNLVHQFLEQ